MPEAGPVTTTAPRQEPLRETGRLLFAAAIFASALLLFLVQPLVGKRILPWFGGAPAVWAVCLAFFQSMLFLGYVYAHLLIRCARPTLHVGLHGIAVVAAFAALPVLPGAAWAPENPANPTAQILAMLTANVALPFFVLASTGPLVQAWFARCYPRQSPYPLYAISNVGSLLGLFALPLLLEPRLSLSATGSLWSFAFVATALAVLGCAVLGGRSGAKPFAGVAEDEAGEKRGIVEVGLWILLAGSAVVVLMGITNNLCLEIASVPFLWVLPLASYLSTFILCFTSERFYSRRWWMLATLILLIPTVGQRLLSLWLNPEAIEMIASIHAQIPLHCALLFSLCMIMHGELYRLRPPARALTTFYLCVSGGGALAGLFVSILAPVVFNDLYEFDVGLCLVGILLLAACANDPTSLLRAGTARSRWVGVGILMLSVAAGASWMSEIRTGHAQHQERNFFGVLRVVQNKGGPSAQRKLFHGITLHGAQLIGEEMKHLPTAYYGQATGVGVALAQKKGGAPRRIGVVGLGVGTLAAYGREGDLMRFYEIDPAVVRIARDAGYFHFLSDSLAKIEVVEGDARLSLATEQERGSSQRFDFLIVDAFSSDAIPVHLLTREAFAHYADALAPGGLLAVHVTNLYFELMPLVARLGTEFQFESLQVTTNKARSLHSLGAKWVMLSQDPNRIRKLSRRLSSYYRKMNLPASALRIEHTQSVDLREIPIWTDDFSDLFSLLRRPW